MDAVKRVFGSLFRDVLVKEFLPVAVALGFGVNSETPHG